MISGSNAVGTFIAPELSIEGEAKVHEETGKDGAVDDKLPDLVNSARPESIVEELLQLPRVREVDAGLINILGVECPFKFRTGRFLNSDSKERAANRWMLTAGFTHSSGGRRSSRG